MPPPPSLERAGGRRHERLTPVLRLTVALHAAGALAIAARPRRWRRVVGLLALNHLVVSSGVLFPRSPLLGPVLTRLPPTGDGRGRVALTLDDGPDPAVTPAVLDVLDAAGARASFFLVAERARRHPGVAAEVVARGHRIENHTDVHSPLFAFYGPWRQEREIDRAQASLAALAGRAPRYLRPPAGLRNPWTELLLARRGLVLAAWTRRGFDKVDGDPRRVARRLTTGLRDGDVLVLHDGGPARTADGRPVVLPVLERLLAAMGDAGLEGVPLP